MTDEAMSPLHRRTMEEMTIRKFAPCKDAPIAATATMATSVIVAGTGAIAVFQE